MAPGIRAVLEASEGAVALLDRKGELIFANPALERLAATPLRDRADLQSLLSLDDLAHARRRFRECAECPGTSVSFECRLLAGDEAVRTVAVTARNRLDDPSLQAIVFSVRDETEPRNAEEGGNRRLARLSALLDAAATLAETRTPEDAARVGAEEAKRILCARYGVVAVVPEGARTSGVERERTRTIPASFSGVAGFDELRLSPPELEAHAAWPAFLKETVDPPPLRGCLAVPLRNPEGRVLGTIELSDKIDGEFTEPDLDILRRLAHLLSIQLGRVRRFEREREALAERQRLLSVLSHDLRNPLNAIQITANLLLLPGGDEERRARHVASILRSAEQMTTLIQKLLEARDRSREES